jgi:hypothetical protein
MEKGSMRTHPLFAALVLALSAGLASAADVKSGPQVDERVPGPFHPLNVNGDNAGKKHCLYCENGDRPVAMIFAREVTPTVTRLIKEIDAATTRNKDTMGSFVVFLGKDEDLEGKLKKVVKDCGLKSTVLSIDNPSGPDGYNVAQDADVTIVLYREFKVKANHAFKKGQLKEKDVQAVLADLPKILAEK